MSRSVPPRTGTRRANRTAVLREVLHAQRVSRSQIAAATGLSPGAVTRITRELMDVGLLVEVGAHAPAGKPGRRFVELGLAAGGGYVLGVDIEASVQHALIIDLPGQVVARQPLDFPRLSDAQASVGWLCRELDSIITRARIDRVRLLGVGVVLVGVVDRRAGVVLDSPIAGWRQVEVARPLATALRLPVRVDGMLNALNLAEHRYGLSRDRRNVVLVHTTLGIGASVLADGHILRGHSMLAGQIAHSRVPGGNLPCGCGRRGCLNTVASGHAILRQLALSPQDPPSGQGDYERERALLTRVLESARAGDERSVTAVLSAGRALGRMLATAVAFCSPEAVLLGGRLGEHPSYIWGVRDGLREYLSPRRPIDVQATRIAPEEAAALLALEDLVCVEPLDIEPLRARRARRTGRAGSRAGSSTSVASRPAS